MNTEPPTKKPWDKEPIRAAEWKANQAAVRAARDGGDSLLRRKIANNLADLIGRSGDPLAQSVGITKVLLEKGYLKKPAWHERSTLYLNVFPTDELLAAYNWIKHGIAPDNDTDEENPF